MNYTELIAALSLDMRLDLAGAACPADREGRNVRARGCTIRFDDAVDVAIEAHEASEAPEAYEGAEEAAAGDVVHLRAVLVPVAGVERARLFAALLQLHVFGAATDDAYFGFDAAQDRVTLSKAQPLRDLDAARAVRSVASFVDQCHRWNAALPTLAASA